MTVPPESISELTESYEIAGRFAREVAQFRSAVAVPANNELRYAGHYFDIEHVLLVAVRHLLEPLARQRDGASTPVPVGGHDAQIRVGGQAGDKISLREGRSELPEH